MIEIPTPKPSLAFLPTLKAGEFNDVVDLLIIASGHLYETLRATNPSVANDMLHLSEHLASELQTYNTVAGALKMIAVEKIRKYGEEVLSMVYILRDHALAPEPKIEPKKMMPTKKK